MQYFTIHKFNVSIVFGKEIYFDNNNIYIPIIITNLVQKINNIGFCNNFTWSANKYKYITSCTNNQCFKNNLFMALNFDKVNNTSDSMYKFDFTGKEFSREVCFLIFTV